MKKTLITESMLNDMADFFLKTLFEGVPAIPVRFDTGDAAGIFHMEPSDDYDEDSDEFKDCPEYRWVYRTLCDGTCGYYEGESYSWEDPLNHPKLWITINEICKTDMKVLTATLLHELLHYYCWYRGLDFRDGDMDFENLCVQMGIPSNYERRKYIKGEYRQTFDYTKVEGYTHMYVLRLARLIEEMAA